MDAVFELPTIPMIWCFLLTMLVLLVAASTLWDWRRSGRLFCKPLPQPFRHRQPQEKVWRRTVEGETLENADVLLQEVCEAFFFNPDDRYRFAPTDRIMDVYRASYPRWRFWRLGDSMEMESLMAELNERFGVGDDTWHPDVTLGEIARRMKSPLRTGDTPERERP